MKGILYSIKDHQNSKMMQGSLDRYINTSSWINRHTIKKKRWSLVKDYPIMRNDATTRSASSILLVQKPMAVDEPVGEAVGVSVGGSVGSTNGLHSASGSVAL